MHGFWPEPFVAGVSLTYDGTRNEHLRHVVPLLNSLELRGTFFAYPPNLIQHLPDWKKAASRGHEIGNAFLYGATDSDGLVPNWPPETLELEFDEAQALIKNVDSKGSFAYPAVKTLWSSEGLPVVDEVVVGSIVKFNQEMLEPYGARFACARTPHDGFNDPLQTRPKAVKSIVADGLGAESLCVLAHLGISKGAWTVFVFSSLADSKFDDVAHESFVRWLCARKEAVMIEPFREIARLLPLTENVKTSR